MVSFDGPVQMELNIKNPLTRYKLSPSAYNIAVTENGNTLSFSVDKPKYLQFEMTGATPLLIIATPLETDIPDKNDPNVLYFDAGVHEAGVINAVSGKPFT